ncbi:uncharacterized protein LY89DRAFT_790414 [Mollisia scopiformis]|uniref:Uncharacterized protein n=1 Tax=Mollisia scopiformis TaxID=149040 RepID=A0A132B2K2_MOLSC|nr:uncharacterized protein LY89DRAFT_790414 [Mollisia scopiformis]KUJ06551.1 hypothetical protein LY89DRAFT_790414 [Mollisia scopiformis]
MIISKHFLERITLSLLIASAATNVQASTTISATASSPSATSTTSPGDSACGSGYLGNGVCGWVSGASTRNTHTILWSCFAVILLCTYKVVHNNVCSENEHLASWRQWPFYRKRLRALGVMVLAIMSPEFISARAVSDWSESRSICLRMKAKGYYCSMVQAHFINMGGLATTTSEGLALLRWESLPELMDRYGWSEVVEQLPSDVDIKDRSKTDSFTATLAIVQSLWLVLECIGRTVGGASISELELSTCAFVLCSLVSYGFWWNKPYDIEHRSVITFPESTQSHVLKVVSKHNLTSDYNNDRVRFEDDRTYPDIFRLYSWYIMASLAVLIVAIHLAAWNWLFPSHVELWLWRLSCLAVLPSCALLFIAGMGWTSDGHEAVFTLVAISVYMMSRLIIVVQIFLCFRKMPESVYTEVPWSYWDRYLPRLS